MARKYSGITQHRRKVVYLRDDFTCQICGWRPADIPENYTGRYTLVGPREDGVIVGLELDHVIPVARGGSGDPSNLQTLCNRCNARKGARV